MPSLMRRTFMLTPYARVMPPEPPLGDLSLSVAVSMRLKFREPVIWDLLRVRANGHVYNGRVSRRSSGRDVVCISGTMV